MIFILGMAGTSLFTASDITDIYDAGNFNGIILSNAEHATCGNINRHSYS